MSDEKHKKKIAQSDNIAQERARCLRVIRRHMGEFADAPGEVNHRVAESLQEIAREVEGGVPN